MSQPLLQPRDRKGRFMARVPCDLDPVPLVEAPPVAFGKDYRTSQIYSKGFEFAFASELAGTWTQACTFIYCKDFLHDAVWAQINSKPVKIHSFKYTPGKDVALDTDHCAFFFRNTAYKGKEAEFHQALPACRELLNAAEAKIGFQPTQIFQVPHDPSPCWLIIGDPGWQHAPPMIGLYTLFIRVGFMHKLGDSLDETMERAKTGKIKVGENIYYAGNRDCSYIKSAWRGIQVILKHGLEVFHPKIEDNYPATMESSGMHDNYGPVGFSAKEPKATLPHWYREAIWK